MAVGQRAWKAGKLPFAVYMRLPGANYAEKGAQVVNEGPGSLNRAGYEYVRE